MKLCRNQGWNRRFKNFQINGLDKNHTFNVSQSIIGKRCVLIMLFLYFNIKYSLDAFGSSFMWQVSRTLSIT